VSADSAFPVQPKTHLGAIPSFCTFQLSPCHWHQLQTQLINMVGRLVLFRHPISCRYCCCVCGPSQPLLLWPLFLLRAALITKSHMTQQTAASHQHDAFQGLLIVLKPCSYSCLLANWGWGLDMRWPCLRSKWIKN
jgi:hypothetical protein